MFTITKYEQSSFVVEAEGVRAALDFGALSIVESVTDAGKVHISLVSHIHPDHFHLDYLLELGAPIYGPRQVVNELHGLTGEHRILTPSSPIQVSTLTIEPVLADHGDLSTPVENLGFVFSAAGRSVYFAGDIARFSEHPGGPFDLVLLPVGGGKVFDPVQAVEFLDTIDHLGLVVPMHYHGRADPKSAIEFMNLAGAHLDVRILEVGETLELK